MSSQSPNNKHFSRYLQILGLAPRKPSLEALTELVAAHITRVPFENISKLYYKRHLGFRGLPDIEVYLEGIERNHFGGTCYTCNYYFHLLLAYLGYDIILCGADMNNPDVHIVSMVKLNGYEYLIDVGYAAPFLNPLPRDLKQDYEITLGRDRYLLKPQDDQGRSCLEMHRDGSLRHGYTAKPIPRSIDHFSDCIAHSYTDDATFMNALLLVRIFHDHSLTINNYNIIRSDKNSSRIESVDNHDSLVRAVVEHFNMKEEIVITALDGLDLSGDAWN